MRCFSHRLDLSVASPWDWPQGSLKRPVSLLWCSRPPRNSTGLWAFLDPQLSNIPTVDRSGKLETGKGSGKSFLKRSLYWKRYGNPEKSGTFLSPGLKSPRPPNGSPLR